MSFCLLFLGFITIPITASSQKIRQPELIHGYYASVSYFDAQIGRLPSWNL